MRRSHFEALVPLCPSCLRNGRGASELFIQSVCREEDDDLLEGILGCPAPECRLEYPVIDGIPILHPDPRAYLAENSSQLLARRDLSDTVSSLVGDALGPGSAYDVTRQHLSTYAWDHYAEFDPLEVPGPAAPGGATRVLEAGLELLEEWLPGPVLDLGCSTGRNSFDLAERSDELVLGVDMSFAMLQLARQVLTEGELCYPRRRSGVVYDTRRVKFRARDTSRIDFWLCDSLALPFHDASFSLVAALNLIDCVYDPTSLLIALNRLLPPQGSAIVATPFDWAPSATPVQAWIGGHSQRGEDGGACDHRFRSVLASLRDNLADFDLNTVAERDGFPWHARLHDRSVVQYTEFIQALRREPR